MAIQHINLGAGPDDKTGTPARQAGQMINQNFDYLDDKISNKNQVITYGTFVLVGQNLTIHAGWIWKINGVEYTNPLDVVINFPYAATGKQRLDRTVFNTSNTFNRIAGPESTSNPIATPPPVDTIEFGINLVTDSSVDNPSGPITGDVYVEKLESQDYVVNYGATTVIEQINLIDNRSSFSLTGSATDVKSVQLAVGFIRPGKPHFFKNKTGHNVTIWHNAGTGNIKYFFPNGVNFSVKPNEVIEFNLNSNDSAANKLEYVGRVLSSSEVMDFLLTGVSFVTGGAITALDKIGVAFGKIQKQITDLSTIYQVILTDVNFGTFINGLASKTTPINADSISIVDSADSNKQKKVSFTNFKVFLKTYFDTLYTVPQITITTSVSITTATNDASGFGQKGRNVIIDNGASAINLTINGSSGFAASYVKHGAGNITFIQGSGRTLYLVDSTAVLNGTVGSTATISSVGTTDYLRISNA